MKDSQNNSRKKSFILYNDQIEIFKELSPEQAGHLIKHVYDYSSGIETTSFQDPSIKIAFIMIKGQMDRDSEKYTQKCEKNRQNINKRYEGKTTTVYDRIRPDTNHTDNDSDNDSDNDNDKEKKEKKEKTSKEVYTSEINPLISLFQGVNPNYERLFANKTQRGALERMIKKFGGDEMRRVIEVLPEILGKPYAPQITTPYQLEQKMGQLLGYLKRKEVEDDEQSKELVRV